MQYNEMLAIRSLDEEGATKYDYYLSNAPSNTPWKEFARVGLAENRVEEAIKRGKSQAGLSDYEVRNWRGWHHHQVFSLITTWFLASETRRGKKIHTGDRRSTNPRRHRDVASGRLPLRHTDGDCTEQNPPFDTKRRSSLSITTKHVTAYHLQG